VGKKAIDRRLQAGGKEEKEETAKGDVRS